MIFFQPLTDARLLRRCFRLHIFLGPTNRKLESIRVSALPWVENFWSQNRDSLDSPNDDDDTGSSFVHRDRRTPPFALHVQPPLNLPSK